ncbi:DUF1203 domain-containing protein [Streptomyces sp. NPDC006368]|uniref:DUF1203 domain-containing protein n=1 Tax=Streptomyces sp. NPDC006368 TaxID=3156760 RepID=UPI0033B872CA
MPLLGAGLGRTRLVSRRARGRVSPRAPGHVSPRRAPGGAGAPGCGGRRTGASARWERWAAGAGVDPGPYDECGPVFVHAEECGGQTSGPRYPAGLHGARRVLRAYGAQGRILGGTLIELPRERAAEVDGVLRDVFADPEVALVHVRAVEFGCFMVEIRRR